MILNNLIRKGLIRLLDRNIGYFTNAIDHYLDIFKKSNQCPACEANISNSHLKVCPNCNLHLPFKVIDWVNYLTEDKSIKQAVHYKDAAQELTSNHPRFKSKVKESKRKSGFNDGLFVTKGFIGKHPVIITILNFDFFNGTIGPIEGKKFEKALEIANKEKLPLISVWTSYGMNMCIDMPSLYQMPKISYLRSKLKVPHISIISGTVLGGTSVSFVQGNIIIGEKNSIFGFTGKNIIKQNYGILPESFQTAEEALICGKIDILADRLEIKNIILNILNCFYPKNYTECRTMQYKLPDIKPKVKIFNGNNKDTKDNNGNEINAAEIVKIAKHPKRPTFKDYLEMFDSFVELKGDRILENDASIIGGLASINAKGVMVIGIEKGKIIYKNNDAFGDEKNYYHQGMVGPSGYLKAIRLLGFAENFNLPVILFVDTPGARMDVISEQRNMSARIDETIQKMLNLKTWTIAINIGEGGSGGFIALACADRLLMLKNSYAAIAANEAKAKILYSKEKNGSEIAANNSEITAQILLEKNYIDRIINEPKDGAHNNKNRAIEFLKNAVLDELSFLPSHKPKKEDLDKRLTKFTAV